MLILYIYRIRFAILYIYNIRSTIVPYIIYTEYASLFCIYYIWINNSAIYRIRFAILDMSVPVCHEQNTLRYSVHELYQYIHIAAQQLHPAAHQRHPAAQL